MLKKNTTHNFLYVFWCIHPNVTFSIEKFNTIDDNVWVRTRAPMYHWTTNYLHSNLRSLIVVAVAVSVAHWNCNWFQWLHSAPNLNSVLPWYHLIEFDSLIVSTYFPPHNVFLLYSSFKFTQSPYYPVNIYCLRTFWPCWNSEAAQPTWFAIDVLLVLMIDKRILHYLRKYDYSHQTLTYCEFSFEILVLICARFDLCDFTTLLFDSLSSIFFLVCVFALFKKLFSCLFEIVCRES